ncbi:hypothetical protein [Rufibacter psychrotolerans]|uniref:hypothetical protein n=1 Tax=Rufibacter psychrotolerans TaxID=2812556 RepID=UPI00196727CE|nr:hypothetical protein [Rufibacter sp. SYSU D00308]
MQKIKVEEIAGKLVVLLQDDVDAADQRLALLWQRPGQYHLWVDCAHLACVQRLGFGHFISQLLLLRKVVEKITLLNLSQKQHRLVALLQLSQFFSVVPQVAPACPRVEPPGPAAANRRVRRVSQQERAGEFN